MLTTDKMIANPRNTVEILKKYEFVFQKRFGQNFLIDTFVLEKIINSASITKEDTVIEIGPGIGSMTQLLCENAGKVFAVEIDKALIPILSDTLKDYDNLTLINADFLKLDLNEQFGSFKNIKVAANLPYYVTTPILVALLTSSLDLASVTVMVQKEVALRMKASPGSKDYGALSLFVQYYCDIDYAANVPPNCFMPRPNVGSAVVTLKRHDRPPVSDEELLFKITRAAFNQRRKTLVNALGNCAELGLTKPVIEEALNKLTLPAAVRGEALTLEDFIRLTDHLYELR